MIEMKFAETLTWFEISVRSLLAALAMVFLVGCSNQGGIDASIPEGRFVESGTQQTRQAAVGGKAAASAQKIFAANGVPNGTKNPSDYKIAPLDVVEVAVFGVKELDRTVQVSSTGMISLPLINQVRAGGRTQSQLERDIAAKLSKTYLQSPQVSVFVKEYNSQRITVDGAVKKPGIFPTTGDVSLLQSIALAEGLTELADPSGILLFRTVDNKRMAARFDLKAIRSGRVQDPILQAGDIVMVDQSSARTTLNDVKSVLPLTGLFQLLLI
jgi:polysaccharide biosynthesis/export protein